MRKFIINIFILSLIFFTASITNVQANGKKEDKVDRPSVQVKMTETEHKNLLDLGFTENEIENMDLEEFNLNKNLKGNVVATSQSFIKIVEPANNSLVLNSTASPTIIEMDEQSYYEEVNAIKSESEPDIFILENDSTTTSYKKMTTTITKMSTNVYRLKNSVTWSKLPSNRYVDVSGVGINHSFWSPNANSQYGKQNWSIRGSLCVASENRSATYNSSSTAYKKGTGGYSLKMNLPDDSYNGCYSYWVESLSSYMYYTVSPLAYSRKLDAFGQYAHQEATYTLSPGISLSGVDFSVTPGTKFSIHPNTHSSITF